MVSQLQHCWHPQSIQTYLHMYHSFLFHHSFSLWLSVLAIVLYGPPAWQFMWQIASRPSPSWYLSSSICTSPLMIIPRYSEDWPCASAMGNHCLASGSTSWQHQSPRLFKSSCPFVAVKPCHPVAGRASEHIRLMGRSLAVEALASSKVDFKSIELIIIWCNAFLNPEGELWSHFFEEKNPDRALNVFCRWL